MSALPKRLGMDHTEEFRSRWRIVRLDTHEDLPGDILEADVDMGITKMRIRGPDKVENDVIVPTFETVTHVIGAGGIAIVGRR